MQVSVDTLKTKTNNISKKIITTVVENCYKIFR